MREVEGRTSVNSPIRPLKPCPFCGSTKIKVWSEGNAFPWVQCEECLASGATYDSETLAIEAWNRRTNNE